MILLILLTALLAIASLGRWYLVIAVCNGILLANHHPAGFGWIFLVITIGGLIIGSIVDSTTPNA